MKAILLAAGFGTRLRPLTNTIPKCLVPINGKPLLQIWLENLVTAGVSEFLINTHYLPEQVENFINSSSYKDICTLKYEPQLLGTAGTLINNLDFIGDQDCMLVHADNFSLADFQKYIAVHKARPDGCVLTMMIFETSTPESCGIVELDNNNRIINFYEKVENPPSTLANGAVYILSPESMNIIKSKYSNCTDFSTEIIPRLLGKIYTYKTEAVFLDIGTPQTYEEANRLVRSANR